MAQNFFSDYPERIEQITKYTDLKNLVGPLEEAFGEPGFYKNTDEAIETYLGVLEEVGKFCANEIKPTAGAIDHEGAKFENGEVILPAQLLSHLKKGAELGVFSAAISRANGGMNLPRSVQHIVLEMFGQACPNTGLTVAAFNMGEFLQLWGTEEQKEKYLQKIITNEYQTSMALTEPNAGSDLGKLRTSATRNQDHWIINGTKQFITNGNSDITFALVRTDSKSSGLKGLSVMIVPREIDGKKNYKVAKIEDKICLHASPTCELVFENSVGYLMGPEGLGFKVMSDLMNAARLAMGALSLGIAMGAMDEAKNYARTRVTMGKPIIQHPMIADMLFEMELECRAIRALIMEASVAYDWMHIYNKKGDEKNFKKWKKRYRRLTPLCKYMGSERAIVIAKNALQMLGGYGVCKDYPLERLWRETIIYPIYEGTSQIQSLMVLKDTLKDVAMQATGFLGSLAGAWAEAKVSRDPVKSALLEARNELNQGIRTILMSIIKEKFKSDIESLKQQKIQDFLKEFSLQLLNEKTDLTYPFLCAERFTRITCDYYALKCMADRLHPDDAQQRRWTLDFAAMAIPRMRLENHYMQQRLPLTLDYMKRLG